METSIKDKMINHLEMRILLKGNQNGFTISTKQLKLFGIVNKHGDKYELVDIIYLDFQNTLDKVPH